MFKSFQIISYFVNEVYGFDLLKRPMDNRFKGIKELENAHRTMISIIDNRRKPFSSEFVEYIYALLEVSVQWAKLKEQGKLTKKFLQDCKNRVFSDRGNFYGAIFEIDMASRCLLSNWDIEFVQDYTKKERQIDFVVYRQIGQGAVGIECTSKRGTEDLTSAKIEDRVCEKAKKFEKEYIEKLGIPLDEKVVVIDITRRDYSRPRVLSDLQNIHVSSKLDAIVITWREDVIEGENHSLRAKYQILGNIDKRYFSTTYAAEFHMIREGPVFFIRKYVEPEPTWGAWGREETAEEYYRKAA